MTTEGNAQPILEDLNIIVAGQGGDGSLTVINLLAELLRNSGLKVYTERDVLSRIRGGHAAATLRAFYGERYCIGSAIKLLVAFDEEAIQKNIRYLGEESVVVYDDSGGKVPSGLIADGVCLYSAPFSRLAMRTMRRELYKNSIAFGFVGRLLGLEDMAMQELFQKHFKRMGSTVLEYNLEALGLGFNLASEMGLHEGAGLYKVKKTKPSKHLLITGNESVAMGFLVAGGRFFCGYPITPSSEILESLEKWLPQYGGVARQTEDELSGINMAIGAALTGTRAMVATSGPGLSLMQEGIGQAGSAEIPVVIVDCQRSGPSTGMPTKPEQCDLNLMVFGGHGDFPRIVLSPGHPEDCFYLTVEALNLAQLYQCPVLIALDQALSQNIATVEPYDLERVRVDQGKRLSSEDLKRMEVYKRYSFADDGVSPYSIPGTPGGLSLVTGNEHNEFGQVSTDPINRARMMDKRMNKVELAKDRLPSGRHFGDKDAEIGLIGIGMTYGVILEAMEQLETKGVHTKYLQPRTIWPILEETLAFIEKCQRIYVVEHNATTQLAHILIRQGAEASKFINLLKYDGTPFRPAELTGRVIEEEMKLLKSKKKEATLQ